MSIFTVAIPSDQVFCFQPRQAETDGAVYLGRNPF